MQGWAFFENAGGSYTCQHVINRLTTFYTKTKVQPYYAYPASQAAGAAMDESYRRLAEYLNVGEDEVHFGPSTSQNTYVLAQAWRGIWQEGYDIIVSNQYHEANAGVWRRLENTGVVVKEWHVDPDSGQLNPADLDDMLSNKTRMIAFPHCSNVVAHVNPVADIAAKGKAAGAIIVTDGVSYAPDGLPDVKGLGPHLGLMTVKRELFERMVNQSHYFNDGLVRKKWLPAGPDHAQIGAAAGIAEYLDARPDDPELRAATVAIIPQKKAISDAYRTLVAHKLMVTDGHFYAVRPLQGMNIPLESGVLRLSFVHYTTEEEIAQLIGGLTAALD